MALKGRFETIRSFDRTRIAYASWGEGPAVVLANGIACSDAYWTYLVPFLAEHGYKVVFFDYRGHGRSGAPANPNEIFLPSHARDLWAVADACGVEDAVLIGHSMGVETILEAYRLAPERVRGLVPTAGAFEHPLNTLYLTTAGRYLLPMVELSFEPLPWLTRAMWRLGGQNTLATTLFAKASMMVARQAPNDLMDEYFKKVSRIDPILLVRMARALQLHTARELLPDVAAPTLVCAGRTDVLTPPRIAREMVSLMADARLMMFERGSHTLPIDVPDEYNNAVLDFLREVEGSVAAPRTENVEALPVEAPTVGSEGTASVS